LLEQIHETSPIWLSGSYPRPFTDAGKCLNAPSPMRESGFAPIIALFPNKTSLIWRLPIVKTSFLWVDENLPPTYLGKKMDILVNKLYPFRSFISGCLSTLAYLLPLIGRRRELLFYSHRDV